MKTPSAFRSSLVVLGLLALASPVDAQAYCALRDPVREIGELYPESTRHLSIVRTVGDSARQEVARQVPFRMHFNELGRHTLYAALEDEAPVGLVHVRSEKGSWGLIEIAWALDLDLKIVDFRFQRCRDKERESIDSPAFRAQIQGMGLDDLKALLSRDGAYIDTQQLGIPAGAEALAATVLRCAMKTIVVTEATWWKDLGELRMKAQAFEDFEGVSQCTEVDSPFSADVLARLQEASLETPVVAWTLACHVRDEEERALGMVVRTLSVDDQLRFPTIWTVGEDGRIVSVRAERGWPDARIESAFLELAGKSLADLENCMTSAEVAGAVVLTMCRIKMDEL